MDVRTWGACAVRSDEGLRCWGSGVWVHAPDTPASKVALTKYNGCIVTEDGSLECWCWGDPDDCLPAPPPGEFIELDAHGDCAYAIDTNGVLSGWGDDACPAPATGLFKDLSVGWSYACGIREDDTVSCWGEAEHGEADPPSGSFSAVNCKGGWNTLAISRDTSALACWGSQCGGLPEGEFLQMDSNGDFTLGVRADHSVVLVRDGIEVAGEAHPPDIEMTQVAMGHNFACGISLEGEIVCWGCEHACACSDGTCHNPDCGQCDPPSLEDE